MTTWLRRLTFWFRRSRLEHELAEEMEAHRAMHQAQLERSGLSPDAARYASRRVLGNVTLAREDAKQVWPGAWVESVAQDVRYALRALGREPGFAATVILVTALGIGATACFAGLLDGLVVRSLPVRAPEQLAFFSRPSFSHPVFSEVQARGGHVFSSVFAWNLQRANVQFGAEPEPLDVLEASGAFYSTLGVNASVGRTFTPADDRIGGGADGLVAMISNGAWERRFSRDPSVIGRTIRVARQPFTIVGVTPPGFFGVAAGLAPEVTIPLTALHDEDDLRSTGSSWVHMMGRLQTGLTVDAANVHMQTLWPAVLEATINPNTPPERRKMYLERQTDLQSARTGFSRVRNRFQDPLWLMMALAGLLLLVACASAVNLLLARASSRSREMAVRLAIGAGRRRLIRQLVTETAVWTLLGGAAGLAIATWGSATLVTMMKTPRETIALDTGPHPRLIAFTIALAFFTAALCAVVPALRATRLDPSSSLRDSGSTGIARIRRWSASTGLVIAQVAIAFLLVAGAALFGRSLQKVLSQQTGFHRDNVLIVATDPVFAGYEGDRLAAYYASLLERVRRVPGVTSAGISRYPPISDDFGAWTQGIGIDGTEPPERPQRVVHFTVVSPDYFRTLGMPLLRGRDFTEADNASAPAAAVVNASLARAYFQTDEVLGRRITIGRQAQRRDVTIVGVVADAKYQRLQEPTRHIAYLSHQQQPQAISGRNLFLEVGADNLAAVGDAVRAEVRAVDGSVPVRTQTVRDRIRDSVVTERVMAVLAGALGLSALILACSSLYGLLAYAVSRRTNEIGLRLAIGAERGSVLWMVLRDCLMVAAVGAVIGLAAALGLARYARALLFEVTPTDPLALLGAAGLTLVVAAAAGLIPARRAASVDPAAALKQG